MIQDHGRFWQPSFAAGQSHAGSQALHTNTFLLSRGSSGQPGTLLFKPNPDMTGVWGKTWGFRAT